MESCQFPSTYTAISGLLDDVDNSKQWNFELWHYCVSQHGAGTNNFIKGTRIVENSHQMS